MQLMLFNLFSPALKLNTGLAILSPGAFEVHSDGIDVDNELFHYPIKKAYTTYNIHTYKTEEVVNQRNIKVKNMTLDEINNTYCNNDYYNQAIREETDRPSGQIVFLQFMAFLVNKSSLIL